MKAGVYEPQEDSYFLSDILKKEIQKLLKENSNLIFFEVGGGSGINLETLSNSGIKKKNIFSCDINENAVQNCRKLGFNCIQSDLFSNISKKFDIIIFNPPYLPEDLNEPKDSKLSTTGGKSGSEIINRFLKQARFHLKKDGKIILLLSSLTKGVKFTGYNKKLLGTKKLFYEKLFVYSLMFHEKTKTNRRYILSLNLCQLHIHTLVSLPQLYSQIYS